MPMSPRQLPRRALALALLIGLRAAAADSFDLSRDKPVPANEPIPVADFLRYPLATNPSINRAGTQVAALYSSGQDWVALMVYDVDRAKFNWLAPSGERNVVDLEWLDDDNLICSYSNPQAIMAVDSRHLDQAYPILQLSSAWPVGVPDQNRREPLIWVQMDSFYEGRDDGVVRVNSRLRKGVLTGPVTQMTTDADTDTVRDANADHILKTYPAPGKYRVNRYLPDKDGELAFAVTSRDGVETLHRFTGDHWETCPVDLDKIDVIGCGDRPGELVVRGARGTGKPRPLQFMDAATGKPGETLLELKDHDFEGRLNREPVHHLIIGVTFEATGPQSVWYAKSYGGLQAMLAKDEHLRGLVVRILGSDVPQRRFLVGAFSDRQPEEYFLLDLEKHSLDLIVKSRPWIDPARMLPMSIMQFKTRDGRRFDAYVTLPPGASKQHPAPLVVLPHNGQTARDSWGYNSEVQFLASRGYAVLQPNYRGNDGYGWQFTREEEWDFRGMSDDITAATKALLTSGEIDPKRVAILGTGQAAYLALSAAVFDPDLYCCCVVNNGFFDWADVIKDQKFFQYDSAFYATAVRFLGDPAKVPEKFNAMSPLAHVDRLKAATLVDCLKSDRLSLSESHRLVAELEKHGVPHEALNVGDDFPGRNHLRDQVEIYSHIEAFLAKYLAGAP